MGGVDSVPATTWLRWKIILRIPRLLTWVVAVALLAVLLAGGWLLSRPRGPVVRRASVSPAEISPNADGEQGHQGQGK